MYACHKRPQVGALAISNPNVPAQRMIEQGAGVTDTNARSLNRVSSAYADGILYGHPIILDYAAKNPDKIIGCTEIFVNGGVFEEIPESVAGAGHYYSEQTQYALDFHIR